VSAKRQATQGLVGHLQETRDKDNKSCSLVDRVSKLEEKIDEKVPQRGLDIAVRASVRAELQRDDHFNRLEEVVNDLKNELSKQKAKLGSSPSSLEHIQVEIDSLKTLVNSEVASVNKLLVKQDQKILSMTNKFEQLSAGLSDLRSTFDSRNQQLENTISALQTEKTAQKEKSEQDHLAIEELSKNVTNLTNDLASEQEQSASRKAAQEELSSTMKALQMNIDDLTTHNNQCELTCKKQKEDIEVLQAENNARKAEVVNSFEQQQTKMNKLENSFTDYIDGVNSRFISLEADTKQMEVTCTEHKKDIEALQAENNARKAVDKASIEHQQATDKLMGAFKESLGALADKVDTHAAALAEITKLKKLFCDKYKEVMEALKAGNKTPKEVDVPSAKQQQMAKKEIKGQFESLTEQFGTSNTRFPTLGSSFTTEIAELKMELNANNEAINRDVESQLSHFNMHIENRLQTVVKSIAWTAVQEELSEKLDRLSSRQDGAEVHMQNQGRHLEDLQRTTALFKATQLTVNRQQNDTNDKMSKDFSADLQKIKTETDQLCSHRNNILHGGLDEVTSKQNTITTALNTSYREVSHLSTPLPYIT
jgi:chromosome segregation ATPase